MFEGIDHSGEGIHSSSEIEERSPNQRQSKDDYFRRHLEPRDAEHVVSEDLRALRTPGKVSRYLPEGSEDINFEHLRFAFSYEMLFSEDVEDIISDDEVNSEIDKAGGITHWRKLNDFLLRDEWNHELRISNLLPSDYRIYFQTAGERSSSCVSVERFKVILLSIDPSTVSAILTLLHEIGHIVDAERENDSTVKEAHDKIITDKKMTSAELDELVRSERNAWAFALRKIKPFLRESSHLNKYSVSEVIHDDALRTYSDIVRSKIEEGIMEGSD